ncbi:MAG: efflux RND transporter periplasmic adaptor subunit, partial [bacterium]
HPRLECGEVIQKGEPLFRIDIRDDERSLEINGKRLSALKRNLELAETDFSRMKKLQKLVAVSDIEKAEQAYNAMFDQVKQLEYVVFRSELNISRAVVMAPFDGRVKTVSVEKGQFVSAGMPLVTLVNDAALEVHTAIDAEKAKSVLRFKKDLESRHPSWFSELEPVPVVVVWSQGANPVKAGGVLHRVIAFEPRSRTLKLAVRLTAGGETPRPVFPIVEGMFCRVEIPGQPIPNVIRIPRQAVQGDNQVHIVVDGRLKTVPVTIRWVEDEVAFVSAGLNSDDQVIVSRLSAPLENALVESSELNLFAASRRSPR